MAKFQVSTSDELTKAIDKLGAETERIAIAMLDAAACPLQKRVVSECLKHKRTGEMAASVKKTKAKKVEASAAYVVVVRPTGTTTRGINRYGQLYERKKPVRNMEIMVHMEFGTVKQAPTPVLSTAVMDSEAECLEMMQKVYNAEVERL